MNARRVAAAAGVVFAAMKTRQTATGIAAALESACMLQSPETAAEQLALLRELDTLRLRVSVLESERAALLAVHVPFPDSPHCQADGERWPCSTRVALPAPAGAMAEDRHLRDELDHALEHLADNPAAEAVLLAEIVAPDGDRRAESVSKLRGLLSRQQSGGAA